jgi:hypothetical protein
VSKRTLAGAAALAVSGLAFSLMTVAPAAAADGDSVCETGEVCLYFNSGLAGAHIGWNGWVNNYSADGYHGNKVWKWPNNGNGYGAYVKNGAGSAANLDHSYKAIVWFNSFPYGSQPSGRGDVLSTWTSYNQLNVTYNNNASHTWTQ